MISWMWELGFCLIGLFVQMYVNLVHLERVGKGKITSWHQRVRHKAIWPPSFFRFIFEVFPLLGICFALELSELVTGVPIRPFSVYWLVVIVLYGDDWLNGTDHNWKKRWDRVRNKVKWKWMPPVPVPVRVR